MRKTLQKLNPTALLEQLINSLNITINDEKFIQQHKDGLSSFSRDRIFRFPVLLTFLMTNWQKGLQRGIAAFAEAIQSDGGSIPEVSKAAFCKARKKIKPEAFKELSEVVLKGFYESNEVNLWHNHRVLAGDGSTVELPNSPEIQREYGVFQNRKDGKAICMGRALMMYDAVNHLTIRGSLDKMEESESSMLWKWLEEMDFAGNDLMVFDRYYASHLLFFYLRQKGAQFCFRMKKNWWKVVETFYNSGKSSQVVKLALPVKDREEAERLGITRSKVKVRLVRVELESGETEILLTSMTNEQAYSVGDMTELYGMRWSIEESYKPV